MGFGVFDQLGPVTRLNLKYYPSYRTLISSNVPGHTVYQMSTSGSIIDVKQETAFNLSSIMSSVIDGKLRIQVSGRDWCTAQLPQFDAEETTLRASSCFYAYPSKKKIEQIYLPLLLPVFKGCKDLALLVASYLEWDNDIVN